MPAILPARSCKPHAARFQHADAGGSILGEPLNSTRMIGLASNDRPSG